MATLNDVARLAGVSPAAVSRHLNRRIVLPPETRKRIDAAVEALNYRPNLLAKRLSTGRTEAVGLVTPEISNPFFAELAACIEAEAAKNGYALYISSTNGDVASELRALDRLRDRHVDGMMFMTNRADDGTLAAALDDLSSVVILDEDIPGARQPRVFVENRTGARLATEHLIALEHRDIAHVSGPPGLMSVNERLAGWKEAMAVSDLPSDRIHLGAYTRTHGFETGKRLVADGVPDAIVACADDVAFGLLEALREARVAVPDDVSLTGFDNMRYSALVAPSLTTVSQPIADIARHALNHLFSLLDGGEPPLVTSLPVELVIRSSTKARNGANTEMRHAQFPKTPE